jgi:WhiB family transcriptional regulator, redox-sensing transcriptional regulator
MDFEITDPRLAGACRDFDPELFAPVSEVGASLRQIAAAKAVCHGCVVLDVCKPWALENNLQGVIAGGLTEGERRAIRGASIRARLAEQKDAAFTS